MSLFERCLQLNEEHLIIKDNTLDNIAIGSVDSITFPQCLASHNDLDLKWLCKHVYYISDIHLVHKICTKFKNKASDAEIDRYIKSIIRALLPAKVQKDMHNSNETIILFGGDISSDFEVAKLFYTKFMQICREEISEDTYNKLYVYAVLGNHELWSFNNVEDCYNTYKEMFESLNIHFLNNNIEWFGSHRFPIRAVRDEDNRVIRYEGLKREDDEAQYKYQMIYLHNVIIVGGIGFAKFNNELNADAGIYRGTLNREDEIEEAIKWEETYNRALNYSKELNCVLLVLTHNPICDWKSEKIVQSNCIYFNGHTHKNYLYHDDELNTHIFSDNQVGYPISKMRLKEAYIYKRINPFAEYNDGYHEVTTDDYLRFYDFIREKITGNGVVENQIKNYNAHFYMIKHKGYYGFFLTSPKGTYISAGGRIKKISKCNDIEKFNNDFLSMIGKYIKILSPYRNAQEQISEAVKSFGGDGKIHGCIIDIDFFNHIMLNPMDGQVTYYFSPAFGLAEKHDTLLSLLEKHNEHLADRYRKQIESDKFEVVKNQYSNELDIISVDIKNSLYSVSNRVNQLQRLFDKKILRDWNESILLDDESLVDFNN